MSQFGFLGWQLANRWQQHVWEALKPVDLTHVQFVLLRGVAEMNQNGEATTQAKLATYLGIDVMMTSKVCRTLARKKLIIRADNRLDHRAKSLIITHKGSELLQQAKPIMAAVDAAFFSHLSSTEQQQLQSILSNTLYPELVKPSLVTV